MGLGEMAKLRGLSRFYERLVGQSGGELTDSRLGLIIGDFMGLILGHEGRGAGKKDHPPGSRKECLFLKEILERKIRTVEGLYFNRWSRSGMRT